MRKIGFAIAALIAFAWSLPAVAQSAPKKYLSLASTNSTLVMVGASGPVGGPGGVLLKELLPVNTTSTIYYLKLYNKATAPVCGTDIPVMTIPVPNAAGAGGGVAMSIMGGLIFPLGLGFCLTGAIADNDTTVAAVGIAINLGVSGR